MKKTLLGASIAAACLKNKIKGKKEVSNANINIIKIAGIIIVLGVITVLVLKYISICRDALLEDEYYDDYDEDIAYFTSDEDFEAGA